MSISRNQIISTLRSHLEPDPAVLALWLEGADASGNVDDLSDIDLCCSVTAGALDAVTACAQTALASLAELDLIEPSGQWDDFHSTVFHLRGTSPYLLIDFNAFVGRGSQFTVGDTIEQPLVLFDRANVVQFIQPDEHLSRIARRERLQTLVNTSAQVSRVEKYIRRGEFLEAFGYYHKFLLSPLIEVLRMHYTPLHPDYFIVHISRHFPAEVRLRLENLFKIESLSDLGQKIPLARAFFDESVAFLHSLDS